MDHETHRQVVIVGAGMAGGHVAHALRTRGYQGRIVLVGEEAHPPYDRPPLSKQVLRGQREVASLYLWEPEQLQHAGIEWCGGEHVVDLNRDARQISAASGRQWDYDRLFLATGGRPRTLPSLPEGPRVHYMRTIEDAVRLKARLGELKRVLVVGGGWIGLEVAATLRSAEKEVVLIEAGQRLCARTLPALLSQRLLQRHGEAGVQVLLGRAPTYGVSDQGVFAEWADGSRTDADAVVVGIGLLPDTGLAARAGVDVDDGVLVDEQWRSSDPAIYAVGDVARRRGSQGSLPRLESWAHAQHSAQVAAGAMLGDAVPEPVVPWFWSDQYDDNLQILGTVPAHAAPVVREYDQSSCAYFFLEGERVAAVIAWNAGRDISVARRWMQRGTLVPREGLADVSLPLQKLAR